MLSTIAFSVESAWGAVPGFLRARFPRPLAEPACDFHHTGLSTFPVVGAWLCRVQGVGIVLPR
jgi:hypothetical protein